jgi:hypothetical protein
MRSSKGFLNFSYFALFLGSVKNIGERTIHTISKTVSTVSESKIANANDMADSTFYTQASVSRFPYLCKHDLSHCHLTQFRTSCVHQA